MCGLLKIQSENLLKASMIAGARAGETPDRHAAHAIGSFRVFVLPGHVVARARGQHLDLVLRGEAFGDAAGTGARSRRALRRRIAG